jgi:hypothetical protein
VTALDRRAFLLRAAALVGGAAGLGALRPPAPAIAAGTALSPARQAICRALLAALRQAPGGRFRHRGAAAGARRFAAWYAAETADMRSHADAVLDAVARYLPGAGAAGRALHARPGGGAPTAAEAQRRAVLLAAVTLLEGADAPAGERTAVEGLA